MEIETEDILLQKCRMQIEERLGWGSSDAWATHDYELLSQKIMEATTVNLSIATLKRIWGKIRYDSKPTVTTLNTLAQYLGFENWRAFTQHQINFNGNGNGHTPAVNGQSHPTHTAPKKSRTKTYLWMLAAVGLLSAGAIYFYWSTNKTKTSVPLDPTRFSFSSKKVVDEGIPNTVIFDYNASAATARDTIYIQQSWDKRLRAQVTWDQQQHTSIYYYPGFFQAKLIVNEQIVKEHNLFIKTNGWLPLIEQKPVPVYFNESDAKQKGAMGLTVDQISSSNVHMQPTTPWVAYYNVRDFGNLTSEDFRFETELKNDYREGSAVCQMTQVHVLLEGATLVVPLSIIGCVSELNFMGKEGKNADLSKLGCDFSHWVKVACEFKNKEGKVFINDSLAFSLKVDMMPVKVVGIAYRFQGTGSVHYLKLSKASGETVFEERF